MISVVKRLDNNEKNLTENTELQELIPVPETEEMVHTATYPMFCSMTQNDLSALQREYYLAGIDVAKAQALTSEMNKQKEIEASHKYKESLIKREEAAIKAQIKEESIDSTELKSPRIYELLGHIYIVLERTDGRTSRPKILIDEEFVSAQKFKSNLDNQAINVLTFVRKGEPVKVVYDSDMVKKSYGKILEILQAHGLNINVSRRLRTQVEEKLYFFFEEKADTHILPISPGYYKDEFDRWDLARPEDLTLVNIKEGAKYGY